MCVGRSCCGLITAALALICGWAQAEHSFDVVKHVCTATVVPPLAVVAAHSKKLQPCCFVERLFVRQDLSSAVKTFHEVPVSRALMFSYLQVLHHADGIAALRHTGAHWCACGGTLAGLGRCVHACIMLDVMIVQGMAAGLVVESLSVRL